MCQSCISGILHLPVKIALIDWSRVDWWIVTQLSQKVLKQGECQERILNGKSYLLARQKSNEKLQMKIPMICFNPFFFRCRKWKPGTGFMGGTKRGVYSWLEYSPTAVSCNGVHFDWPAHDSDWCAIPLFSPACASWDQVVDGKAVFSSRQSFSKLRPMVKEEEPEGVKLRSTHFFYTNSPRRSRYVSSHFSIY